MQINVQNNHPKLLLFKQLQENLLAVIQNRQAGSKGRNFAIPRRFSWFFLQNITEIEIVEVGLSSAVASHFREITVQGQKVVDAQFLRGLGQNNSFGKQPVFRLRRILQD